MAERREAPIRFWGGTREAPRIAWDRVENAIDTAYTYWLTSVSLDGRPQSRVVWGLWHEERLILSVGSTTIWRNLEASPQVSVNLPSGSEVVIIEGTAAVERDRWCLLRYLERYNPKYAWNFPMEAADSEPFVSVWPRTVLSWLATPLDSSPESASLFPRAASKWVWE